MIEWILREARVAPGMTALDVGSGTGLPGLDVARAVRPGKVIATDVAVEMLAGLERRARTAGITNVEVRELDMHDLQGIGNASIDAVTSSFTLMFSPAPARVLGEIQRVLRPGGRLALSVWDGPDANPFFTTMFGAVAKLVPTTLPAPGAPGPFGLAAPGALEQAVRAAGFRDVRVEPVPYVWEFDSIDQHWEINSELAPPLARAKATLPPDELARLRAELASALAPYMEGSKLRIPATPLCAAGTK